MQLLVIRHAIAEDREEFAKKGRADAMRPLTDAGQKKMRRAARGLRLLAPELSLLVTSPLTRAVQTGQIVAQRYHDLKTLQIAPLSPRKPLASLLEWLQSHGSKGPIAIIGHEPQLGNFVGWLLTGLKESFVVLKKGGAVMLEIEGEITPGRAKLLWMMRPGQLRDLGKQ